jgi:hypothetical protein
MCCGHKVKKAHPDEVGLGCSFSPLGLGWGCIFAIFLRQLFSGGGVVSVVGIGQALGCAPEKPLSVALWVHRLSRKPVMNHQARAMRARMRRAVFMGSK